MAQKKTPTGEAGSARGRKRSRSRMVAAKSRASARKATRACQPKTGAKKTAASKRSTPKAAKKKATRKKTVARKGAVKRASSKRTASARSAVRGTARASKKAAASETTARAASPEKGAEKPLPKTRLTDKQLQMFKEMLLAKRRELLGDVRTLTQDALGRSRQDSAGDLSSMPIHMADIGSDNWEQDFTIGLIANEQQLVREIDEAFARIEDRTYGICLATRKPITIARLRAKPWAKYCIEYARKREMDGV